MNRRDLLINKYAFWDGNPCTEPDGDLESALDDFDDFNDLDD